MTFSFWGGVSVSTVKFAKLSALARLVPTPRTYTIPQRDLSHYSSSCSSKGSPSCHRRRRNNNRQRFGNKRWPNRQRISFAFGGSAFSRTFVVLTYV